jgi:hypothetical protein
MKLALTSFLAFTLLALTSCKKDKASGLEKISGNYIVYKLIVEDPDDGPLEYPVPSPDGNHSTAIIKANSDSTMSLHLVIFDKQNDTLEQETWTGRAVKVSNGDLRFMDGNDWMGTFVDDNEVEIYPDSKTTLYARK